MRYLISFKSSKCFALTNADEYLDTAVVVFANDNQEVSRIMRNMAAKIDRRYLPLSTDFIEI